MTNVCVGRKAQEGRLDFHTAPELSYVDVDRTALARVFT